MRLGNAQFPRQTRMFDTGQRRSTRAARVARDQDVIRVRFGDPCCDCPDADFGNQFDADPRCGIRVFQIVNQLRKIFDRIDVMVRWRTDQTNSGC